MDLELIARTTAVLLAASALTALLRRAAPSTRHLVWHLSIVIVLLAPILILVVPRVPVVPEVPGVGFVAVPVALPDEPTTSRTTTTPQNETLRTVGTIGTFGTAGVLVWFLFCWILSGLSLWRGSIAGPASWSAEASAIARRMGMKRPVEIRQMRREGSPHVAGLFTSVVMLPPSAASWSFEARQAALVHELMHIRRHDRRTQAVAQLACAIYWFNPLVWYAAAGLARERERACDDEVLRFGAKPSAYATLLLDIARLTGPAWTPATALSMARPSAIEGRLLAILGDVARTPRRSTRWLVGLAIASLTTAILGAQATAGVTPAAAEPPARASRTAQKGQDLMDPPQPREETPAPMTKALVRALGDPDQDVREHAAMGLAITAGADVIDPLLTALRDTDAQVREKAAIGLAFRRDPRIIDPLLAAMEDRDAQVREKAAIALGASGDPRVTAALTKALSDPDSQVREKAVAGLALLGQRR